MGTNTKANVDAGDRTIALPVLSPDLQTLVQLKTDFQEKRQSMNMAIPGHQRKNKKHEQIHNDKRINR